MKGIFRYNGIKYEVNITDRYLRTFNGSDYYLVPSGNGQLVRQVLNQMKKLDMVYFEKVYVKTKSFSMGNDLNCYVVGANDEDFKIIKDFINYIQYGNFNGYIDLYEYNDEPPQLELDECIIDIGIKYTFCHKGFPYGTKGYYEQRLFDK
jgi:hypothetical protein